MYICYVDESGDVGALRTPNGPDQPVLVLAGVIVPEPELTSLTVEFLKVKRKFYPGLFRVQRRIIDGIKVEVKGAEVRRQVRTGSRRERRHAVGFLDKVVGLLEDARARLVGRVWVKGVGEPFDGRAVYTSSMQAICAYLQAFLEVEDGQGIMIADSRTAQQNQLVSHSIFTQKFKKTGDAHPRVVELPTYGHSDNHAGLQIVDLIAGGLLTPMAAHTYCTGHVHNVHVSPEYIHLRTHFRHRLRAMQFRYQKSSRTVGGITVSDGILRRSGGLLFAAPRDV